MTNNPVSSPVRSFSTSDFHNIMASTANNTTSFLNPSPKDLFMVLPRMVAYLGSFVFVTVPERIDNIFGLGIGGRVVAEATGDGLGNFTSAAIADVTSTPGMATAVVGGATMTEDIRGGKFNPSLGFQHGRNIGGIFTYMTSKWALTCFCFVSSTYP